MQSGFGFGICGQRRLRALMVLEMGKGGWRPPAHSHIIHYSVPASIHHIFYILHCGTIFFETNNKLHSSPFVIIIFPELFSLYHKLLDCIAKNSPLPYFHLGCSQDVWKKLLSNPRTDNLGHDNDEYEGSMRRWRQTRLLCSCSHYYMQLAPMGHSNTLHSKKA